MEIVIVFALILILVFVEEHANKKDGLMACRNYGFFCEYADECGRCELDECVLKTMKIMED